MIPVAKPYLGEEEALAAREAILSGWVTQGPRVKAFEDAFAAYVGAGHACAVSSCTTALHLALLGVGVGPGDLVLTVSHSFIATANCIRYCGAEPLFVDIDPQTYNMDVTNLRLFLENHCEEHNGAWYFRGIEQLSAKESPLRYVDSLKKKVGRIGAVLPVHQMGMPCAIADIVALARQYRLPVVEDAACAIGSRVANQQNGEWEKAGKPHGDAACFSFHPRKILTTGDGGMITTNNPELDRKFRLWRQHGMSVPDTLRHAADSVIFEEYLTTGFNYRMTDIQAAIGIAQLKKLDGMITERRQLAEHYKKLLEPIPFIHPPVEPEMVQTNYQSYPARLAQNAPIGSRELIKKLHEKGISSRLGIMNSHQEKPYAGPNYDLPHSETAREHTILLPLYNGMEQKLLSMVCNNLQEILKK